MIDVSLEALRVSRGMVLWVVCGETDKGEYQPGPEGLIWKWYERGYSQKRPCYWLKNGMFGSGSYDWFRNDIEYILAFKAKGPLPFAHATAMGAPPKYPAGGDPTHRNRDGSRVGSGDDYDHSRRPDGTRRLKKYKPPRLCNPGNVVKASVGKNHMGHPLAHENEAPYPEALPHHFINTHCPPGGIVCDPFCGSGTTLAAAVKAGRKYVGFDIRQSQVDLSLRRLAEVWGHD